MKAVYFFCLMYRPIKPFESNLIAACLTGGDNKDFITALLDEIAGTIELDFYRCGQRIFFNSAAINSSCDIELSA
jgi:hypothetical protein